MSGPDTLHLTAESFSISRQQKEDLNGHRSFVIWLTGLPASGKSTIARELEKLLHRDSIRTLMLDGDNTRIGINKDLDFSPEGRKENIRRVAEIAKLMNEAGVVVIACFISPLEKDRVMAREIIGSASFIETFIDTPLDICIQRDPKGLYQQAISGKIADFTGIGSPYEPPAQPDIVVPTVKMTPEDSAKKIYDWLKENNIPKL